MKKYLVVYNDLQFDCSNTLEDILKDIVNNGHDIINGQYKTFRVFDLENPHDQSIRLKVSFSQEK